LIVSGKEERLIAFDRPSDRRSKLMLYVDRIHARKRRRCTSERTVAQVIKGTAVPTVRSRLSHHIDDRAARTSRLRPIAVRRDAELRDHFVRELVGRAISPARLREESVVVVRAVNQV